MAVVMSFKALKIFFIMNLFCLVNLLLMYDEFGFSKARHNEIFSGVLIAILAFWVIFATLTIISKKTNKNVLGGAIFVFCVLAVFMIYYIEGYYYKVCIGDGVGWGIITACITIYYHKEELKVSDTEIE